MYTSFAPHHACADFKFDVSDSYPTWIREQDEDEVRRVRLRSAAAAAAATAGGGAAATPNPRLHKLIQMGWSVDVAQAALDAAQGDFDAAILMLVGGDD